MTEDYSESELRESMLNGTKLDLRDLLSHSQAVEWAVKLTTEASQTAYGFEARHQHITAKVLSQKLRMAFLSKGSYMEQYDYILSSIKIVVLFPYLFACYIFTYNRKKKTIFKVFKNYYLIQNVKKQFIEEDTENVCVWGRLLIYRLVIISLINIIFIK